MIYYKKLLNVEHQLLGCEASAARKEKAVERKIEERIRGVRAAYLRSEN